MPPASITTFMGPLGRPRRNGSHTTPAEMSSASRSAARAASAIAVSVGFFSGPVVKELLSHDDHVAHVVDAVRTVEHAVAWVGVHPHGSAVVDRRSGPQLVERVPGSSARAPRRRTPRASVAGPRRCSRPRVVVAQRDAAAWWTGRPARRPTARPPRRSAPSCRRPARRTTRRGRGSTCAGARATRGQPERQRRTHQRGALRRTAPGDVDGMGQCAAAGAPGSPSTTPADGRADTDRGRRWCCRGRSGKSADVERSSTTVLSMAPAATTTARAGTLARDPTAASSTSTRHDTTAGRRPLQSQRSGAGAQLEAGANRGAARSGTW